MAMPSRVEFLTTYMHFVGTADEVVRVLGVVGETGYAHGGPDVEVEIFSYVELGGAQDFHAGGGRRPWRTVLLVWGSRTTNSSPP